MGGYQESLGRLSAGAAWAEFGAAPLQLQRSPEGSGRDGGPRGSQSQGLTGTWGDIKTGVREDGQRNVFFEFGFVGQSHSGPGSWATSRVVFLHNKNIMLLFVGKTWTTSLKRAYSSPGILQWFLLDKKGRQPLV